MAMLTGEFGDFVAATIKEIDEMRSIETQGAKDIEGTSVKPKESRINTFYRMIGLPAFVKSEGKTLAPANNGNLFAENFFSQEQEDAIEKRELYATLDKKTENDIYLELKRNKISLEASLTDRTSGTLFPMIVDGSLEIEPVEKRIAAPFLSEKTELKRPLIEFIVLLRMNDKGIINTTLSDDIQAHFKKLGVTDKDLEINVAEYKILNELMESLLNMKEIISETVKQLSKENIELSKEYRPKNSKSEAQSETVGNDGTGSIEKLENEQLQEKNIAESIYSTLDYDDTIVSSGTRNLKNAALASHFLSLISQKIKSVDRKINETQRIKEKKEEKKKTLNRNIDFILGSFSGISGLDIMIIVAALFIIDIKDLLGLLNADAIVKLKSLKKGVNTPSFEQTEVSSAIKSLETHVAELFKQVRTISESEKMLSKVYKTSIPE